MKQYFIRVISTSDIGTSNGVVLGYVGFDRQSGGYSYNNGKTPLSISKHFGEEHMVEIATKTEMTGMADGGLNFPYDIRIFISEYAISLGFKKYVTGSCILSIKIELIELDMSDILNIKSRILRSIAIEGREAENWKTRDKAYFKIISDTFN